MLSYGTEENSIIIITINYNTKLTVSSFLSFCPRFAWLTKLSVKVNSLTIKANGNCELYSQKGLKIYLTAQNKQHIYFCEYS